MILNCLFFGLFLKKGYHPQVRCNVHQSFIHSGICFAGVLEHMGMKGHCHWWLGCYHDGIFLLCILFKLVYVNFVINRFFHPSRHCLQQLALSQFILSVFPLLSLGMLSINIFMKSWCVVLFPNRYL